MHVHLHTYTSLAPTSTSTHRILRRTPGHGAQSNHYRLTPVPSPFPSILYPHSLSSGNILGQMMPGSASHIASASPPCSVFPTARCQHLLKAAQHARGARDGLQARLLPWLPQWCEFWLLLPPRTSCSHPLLTVLHRYSRERLPAICSIPALGRDTSYLPRTHLCWLIFNNIEVSV